MICQKCGKNEATVFIDATLNGVRWKYHVCARCASREAIAVSPARNNASSGRNSRSTCPVCGTSRRSIADSARFGCAVCYEIFGEGILESGDARKKNGDPSEEGKDISSKSPPQETSGKETVGKLRVEMEKAVRREDFERAAAIRDKIKKHTQ